MRDETAPQKGEEPLPEKREMVPDPFAGSLDDYIDRYECAQARDGAAELTEFLPNPADPLYLSVLRELVRVDLEYGWQRGRPTPLDDYRRRFPELFRDQASVQEITFEEFRLQKRAGKVNTYSQYLLHASRDAPNNGSEKVSGPFSGTPEKGPDTFSLPCPGTDVLGFHILAELGSGALGKVYLARQGDLANRFVVLKFSTEQFAESQTLAQLQHTHIVPIYSVHRSGPYQIVCMPYLGTTTLADVLEGLRGGLTPPESGQALTDALVAHRERLGVAPATSAPAVLERLQRQSYVDAVLGLAADLADGLAHAHERGILHRDLKPANILLTDDGRPMLLDFNLSEDIKLRDRAPAARLGGTLPYLAPEHLEAFQPDKGTQLFSHLPVPGVAGQARLPVLRQAGDSHLAAASPFRAVDARSDLYSLGLIVYELLACRLPYPVHQGPLQEVLTRMIAERRQPPPPLTYFNRAVTPAIAAIVERCLATEPPQRYQHATQLAAELRRQLAPPDDHAPEPVPGDGYGARGRRPRPILVCVLAAVTVAAFLALGALCMSVNAHLAELRAAEKYRQFQHTAGDAQFLLLAQGTVAPGQSDEAESLTRKAVDHYAVLEDPDWRQQREVTHLPPADHEQLREEVGELLLLWARLTLEKRPADGDSAAAALRLNRLAEACYAPGPAPQALWLQRADIVRRSGGLAEGDRLTIPADPAPAADGRALGLQAGQLTLQGRWDPARDLLRRAVRLDPGRFRLWAQLALCEEALGREAEAIACYDTCAALQPGFAPLYFRRGNLHLRRQEYALAVADLDQALRLRPNWAEAEVRQAQARACLLAGKP